MNTAAISFAYLRARPLATALNLLLLALGIATITVLLLASHQLEQRMQRDSAGIDLVVGAKGSPLQLVLSALYQVDIPTGNIALSDARDVQAHRMVKKAIPIAMGDSVGGFRIVGTSHDYPAHFGAALAAGRLWEAPLEAVPGALAARDLGLVPGARFEGVHGLGGDGGGSSHAATPYTVTGVLAPTGTVVDRLVLTGVESVWLVHTHLDDLAQASKALADMAEEEKEVTALLVQYATPLAAAMLPRFVNATAGLQAASPAFETARMFQLVGAGVDAVQGMAWILVFAAGLSVFIALYGAMEERRRDLAVMRMLGASPARLFLLVLFEGALLAAIGAVIGLVAGHALTEVLGFALASRQQPAVTGWALLPGEYWIALAAVGVGLVAALIPAIRAYRTDIAATLARG
jgi:putative ABC transport system permease protein